MDTNGIIHPPLAIRVAGAVVLYNSKIIVLDNIYTYINQVEKLYVIDNSDHTNLELVEQIEALEKVYYISNNNNLGIAYALNTAAREARNAGYTHLLTMDDDSKAPPDMVETMISFLSKYPEYSRVGIVSAIHSEEKFSSAFRTVLYTMTSGNLLNLNIHQKVGGFWDELFVDHVDHEFGLRLNNDGYQVIELSGILLNHALGQRKPLSWPGPKYFVSHQPPRVYYITRNGLLVAKKYPRFRLIAARLILKEWIKLLLWEDRRYERINLVIQAVRDAYNRKMGKLNLIIVSCL